MADLSPDQSLRELRRNLKRLPKAIQKRELNRSVRKGANLVRDAAISLAPVESGVLREHIVVQKEKKRYLQDASRMRVGVKTGRGKDSPFYWRFLEFGTSRMPAQPFLRPAFELTKHDAAAKIKEELRKGIERQARKLNK